VITEDTLVVDAENPWPGISSYSEGDEEFFRGREAQGEELFRRLTHNRLTVLYGLAGLGKTSLLQCGVFDRARKAAMLPIPIHVRFDPDAPALRQQVFDAIRNAAPPGFRVPAPVEGGGFWEYFHRNGEAFWNNRHRRVLPLLVFDQFEEMFTHGLKRPDRLEFIGELAHLIQGTTPPRVHDLVNTGQTESNAYRFNEHEYRIVIALREDFLSELLRLQDLIPSIGSNLFPLGRMNGEEAKRVIEAGRALVDPAAVQPIINFVAGATAKRSSEQPKLVQGSLSIEPALLNVVLRELNEKRKKRNPPGPIDETLLTSNRDQILREFYDRCLDGLGPRVREFVEKELITGAGFRDSIDQERACEEYGLDKVTINTLMARRLIHIDDRGGTKRIELTHDLLTEVIRESRDQHKKQESERKQAEELAEAKYKAQRARALAMVFLIITVIALAGIAFAVVEKFLRRREEKQHRVDMAQWAYSAAKSSLDEGNVDLALAHLGTTLRNDASLLNAQRLVLNILEQYVWYVPAREITHPAAVSQVELSSDGNRLLTIAGGAVYVWDARTGTKLGGPLEISPGTGVAAHLRPHSTQVITVTGTEVSVWDGALTKRLWQFAQPSIDSAEYGADGARINIQSDNALMVYDANTFAPVRKLPSSWEFTSVIDTSGRWLAQQQKPKTLLITDMATGRSKQFDYDGSPAAFDVSPDGNLFIVGTEDGQLALGDFNAGKFLKQSFATKPLAMLRFSPAGDAVISVSDKTAQLWNIGDFTERGKEIARAQHIDGDSVRFTDDGSRVFIRSGDRALFHDAMGGDEVSAPIWRNGTITSSSISADGTHVATVVANQRSVDIWSTPGMLGAVNVHASEILGTIVSKDGSRTGTYENDGADIAMAICDNASGKLLRRIPKSRAVSSDLHTALLAGDELGLMDVDTGRVQPLVREQVANVTISADGTVVVLTRAGMLKILKPDGEVIASFNGEAPRTTSMSLSPDHSRLLTAIQRRSRLWDTKTGRPLKDVEGYSRMSNDGRFVVVRSGREAMLLDAQSGKPVHTFGHDFNVASAEFDESSQYVTTVTVDAFAHVWNLADFTEKRVPTHLSGASLVANIDRDTNVLAARSATLGEGELQLWDMALDVPVSPRLFDQYVGRPTISIQRPLCVNDGTTTRLLRLEDVKPQDAAIVAALAEFVAGVRIEHGAPAPLDKKNSLPAAKPGNTTVAGLLNAFRFTSPDRPAFPGAKVTVDQFIRQRLNDEANPKSRETVRRELVLLYPGATALKSR